MPNQKMSFPLQRKNILLLNLKNNFVCADKNILVQNHSTAGSLFRMMGHFKLLVRFYRIDSLLRQFCLFSVVYIPEQQTWETPYMFEMDYLDYIRGEHSFYHFPTVKNQKIQLTKALFRVCKISLVVALQFSICISYFSVIYYIVELF